MLSIAEILMRSCGFCIESLGIWYHIFLCVLNLIT